MEQWRDERKTKRRWSALYLLAATSVGLLSWQAPASAAVRAETPAAATAASQADSGKESMATAVTASAKEGASSVGEQAVTSPAARMDPAHASSAKQAPRADVEVQLEYLDGRFFKKRNVDLYNVHVYRQYKELGALSLHYGLTFERALGYTTEDDIWRDAEAVGFGPSYMMRWTKHVSGKLDASLDASGSLLAYNHAHPGNGRAYGFLWRIGPRLMYHYTDRDALSLAYIFHHSSNGMGSHNPGYNGIGFSLGFTHWY